MPRRKQYFIRIKCLIVRYDKKGHLLFFIYAMKSVVFCVVPNNPTLSSLLQFNLDDDYYHVM